jgi:hypothetical protein
MTATKEILPGIYPHIPDADYRAWPYPSYSLLSNFRDEDKCELEIAYAIEHPDEQTEEMSLGNMVEQAIDNPNAVGGDTKVLPPEIKARRGAVWQAFQAANPGIEWLPPSEYAKHGERVQVARDMAASVKEHKIARVMLDGAERQVSFVCDLEFVGASGQPVTHRVKGRVDYLQRDDGCIVDLKTCAFGNPRKVGARMWQYAYDVQSALYTDCMTKLLGREMEFFFVFVRSVKPYVVTPYNGHNTTEMAGHFLTLGRAAYQVYLEQLAECRMTGVWHGYRSPDSPDSPILDVYLPAWAV